MPKPSVIVFDLGKVLLDFDYGISARRIAERCHISIEQVREHLDHSPLLYEFETGLLSIDQFFAKVATGTKFSGEQAEFCEFFADIFTPIEPMVELHRQLRAKGLPTWIFSNTNALAIGHIQKRFPFFQNFDGYVLSYEHGAMKPDPKIYEVVERQTERRGAEILYIDDRPENIETGIQRGWQTILQENPDKIISRITELGLLV
jgi:HAD superfamily hydrolase (TIGR01509 family)